MKTNPLQKSAIIQTLKSNHYQPTSIKYFPHQDTQTYIHPTDSYREQFITIHPSKITLGPSQYEPFTYNQLMDFINQNLSLEFKAPFTHLIPNSKP